MKHICTNCKHYPFCNKCKYPQDTCDKFEKKGMLK